MSLLAAPPARLHIYPINEIRSTDASHTSKLAQLALPPQQQRRGVLIPLPHSFASLISRARKEFARDQQHDGNYDDDEEMDAKEKDVAYRVFLREGVTSASTIEYGRRGRCESWGGEVTEDNFALLRDDDKVEIVRVRCVDKSVAVEKHSATAASEAATTSSAHSKPVATSSSQLNGTAHANGKRKRADEVEDGEVLRHTQTPRTGMNATSTTPASATTASAASAPVARSVNSSPLRVPSAAPIQVDSPGMPPLETASGEVVITSHIITHNTPTPVDIKPAITSDSMTDIDTEQQQQQQQQQRVISASDPQHRLPQQHQRAFVAQQRIERKRQEAENRLRQQQPQQQQQQQQQVQSNSMVIDVGGELLQQQAQEHATMVIAQHLVNAQVAAATTAAVTAVQSILPPPSGTVVQDPVALQIQQREEIQRQGAMFNVLPPQVQQVLLEQQIQMQQALAPAIAAVVQQTTPQPITAPIVAPTTIVSQRITPPLVPATQVPRSVTPTSTSVPAPAPAPLSASAPPASTTTSTHAPPAPAVAPSPPTAAATNTATTAPAVVPADPTMVKVNFLRFLPSPTTSQLTAEPPVSIRQRRRKPLQKAINAYCQYIKVKPEDYEFLYPSNHSKLTPEQCTADASVYDTKLMSEQTPQGLGWTGEDPYIRARPRA